MPEYYSEWEECEVYLRLCSAVVVQLGITAVSEEAFQYSWLSSAELPEGLESIGDEAFVGCADLEDLIAAIGEPIRVEYSVSVLVTDGEDGVLYYGGFMVNTIRFPNGEEYIMGTAN